MTVECPERGVLLLRVRDELRMTLSAYQTVSLFQVNAHSAAVVGGDAGAAGLSGDDGVDAEIKDLEAKVGVALMSDCDRASMSARNGGVCCLYTCVSHVVKRDRSACV